MEPARWNKSQVMERNYEGAGYYGMFDSYRMNHMASSSAVVNMSDDRRDAMRVKNEPRYGPGHPGQLIDFLLQNIEQDCSQSTQGCDTDDRSMKGCPASLGSIMLIQNNSEKRGQSSDAGTADNQDDEYKHSKKGGGGKRGPSIANDGAKNFTCGDCGHSFSKKYHLLRHTRCVHEDTKSYKCTKCGKIFTRRENLRKHMVAVHDRFETPAKAATAGSDTSASSSAEKKVETSDPSNAWEQAETSKKEGGKRPRKAPDGYKNFLCGDCGHSFSRKSHLVRHTQCVHYDSKPFLCSQCDKCFTRRENLRKHTEFVHEGIEPPPNADFKSYKCGECNMTFTRRYNLKKHEYIVHQGIEPPTTVKPKPYKCTECVKTFSSKDCLSRHVYVIHKGIKPYICRDCNKTFPTEYHLNRHSNVHTKAKSLLCTMCGEQFMRREELDSHMEAHSEEAD